MKRRVYEERTSIAVKDVKDQPEEKYIAFIETLGERSAVAFNKIVFSGNTVVLLASPEKISDKEGVMVAAFPVESKWVVFLRDRAVLMTGEEWEQCKMEDNKSMEKIMKSLFGDKPAAQVVLLPDGKQILLPATEEQKKLMEETKASQGEDKKEEKKVVDGNLGQYL